MYIKIKQIETKELNSMLAGSPATWPMVAQKVNR